MTTRSLALLAVGLFFATIFVRSWSGMETDFPNYYTAARLVAQGEPLRNYYDWTWFERQMNYAGFERQLGAYTAQTPLTMLPFVGLVRFSPLTAKRIWLVLNTAFLGGTICTLASLTRFRLEQLVLLTACAYGALRTNFLYGQYYIFLLLLLTVAFFCLQKGREGAGGFFFAVAFVLKLYGGPFLLYFAARRNARAVAGMAIALALAVVVTLMLFGWRDTVFYASQIFPRSLQAGQVDPYNPGNPTLNTLLWHLFLPDAELNPKPALSAPWLFFYLRPFLNLLIVVLTLLGLHAEKNWDSTKGFAWFFLAVLLLSTSVSSYTYVLLLLPVVLLLDELPLNRGILLFVCFLLLTAPTPSWLRWLFPKLLLLASLFVWLGIDFLRCVSRRQIAVGALTVASISALIGWNQFTGYREEPGRRYELAKVEQGSLFSSSPAVIRMGIFYQGMGKDRYVLRWLHEGRIDTFSFDGNAFAPSARSADGPINFELVSHGASARMQLDPANGTVSRNSSSASGEPRDSSASPNKKWIAFVSHQGGPRQIWIRERGSSMARRVTGGNCNSWAPTWELDSSALLFASDCGRAYGLPTLYRARLTEIQ
jgi:hypothetical protein